MVWSMPATGGITEAAFSPLNQRCTDGQTQPVPSNMLRVMVTRRLGDYRDFGCPGPTRKNRRHLAGPCQPQ